jgi:5'-nucleotidase
MILVSNDDGYASPGLRALVEALKALGDVVAVAPESEQSATSHSLSLHRPLRARKVEPGIFAIDGTPADCVYAALHGDGRFLPRWPDLICSGINRGLNLGQDAFYSGTIAAAREAALRGIPALALSADTRAPLAPIGDLAVRLGRGLLALSPKPTGRATPLLSVNVPLGWNGKVTKTRLGARLYEELLDVRKDPRGREYMWLGGPGVRHDPDPGSDTHAFDEGSATVTSLVLDLTRNDDDGLTERLAAAAQLA